jgi:SAM-dependent methyltransferase
VEKNNYIAAALVQLNNDFYNYFAREFSATRQAAWAGWEKLRLYVAGDVLDVAAGNLRFKKYLDKNNVQYTDYLAIDSSLSLLQTSGEKPKFYRKIDVLQCLVDGENWGEKVGEGKAKVGAVVQFDFIICSAFFHHIPSAKWREQMLKDLLSLVKKGGYVVVSYWRFFRDEKIASSKKIVQDLGAGDFLLSFAGDQSHPRYCHSFSDEDITQQQKIARNNGATLVADFLADGKSGADNHYLVWQKN